MFSCNRKKIEVHAPFIHTKIHFDFLFQPTFPHLHFIDRYLGKFNIFARKRTMGKMIVGKALVKRMSVWGLWCTAVLLYFQRCFEHIIVTCTHKIVPNFPHNRLSFSEHADSSFVGGGTKGKSTHQSLHTQFLPAAKSHLVAPFWMWLPSLYWFSSVFESVLKEIVVTKQCVNLRKEKNISHLEILKISNTFAKRIFPIYCIEQSFNFENLHLKYGIARFFSLLFRVHKIEKFVFSNTRKLKTR